MGLGIWCSKRPAMTVLFHEPAKVILHWWMGTWPSFEFKLRVYTCFDLLILGMIKYKLNNRGKTINLEVHYPTYKKFSIRNKIS